MNKSKILASFATASLVTALSMAFTACGDESSSTSPEPIVDTESSSSVEEPLSSSEVPSSSSEKTGSSSETPSSSSEQPGSSSEVSSSSGTQPESSSAQQTKPVQTADNISGSCIENISEDPLVDGAIPPVTYMKVDSDSATIILERVKSSCQFISGFTGTIEQPITSALEITAAGDTLYVKPKMEQTASQQEKDCTCPARITFKIKADTAFTNAKILVVDDNLNAGNRMQIVKTESKIEPDDKDILKKYGLSRGTCMETANSNVPTIRGLPVADLTVYENGLAILDMNFVEDYCDIKAKLSQKVVEDTLFLDYYDITDMSRCTCVFDSHKFELEPKNTGAQYAKFRDVVYFVNQITYVKIPNWND